MGMKKLVRLEKNAVKASSIVLNYCKMHKANYYDCSQCVFADYDSKKCQIGVPSDGWNIEKTIDDFKED